MEVQSQSKVQLTNSTSVLEIDACGGAISSFLLADGNINPLNFELPVNNKSSPNNAVFKGHFLCLGRWGDPSEGEHACGAVKHGDFFIRRWNVVQMPGDKEVQMNTESDIEGLQIERHILLDKKASVFYVKESIKNINKLGRFYNMVQHPTIAAPFLNAATRVFSNAAIGICQDDVSSNNYSTWPTGIRSNGTKVDLSLSDEPDNNIFSFIVKPGAAFGWLVAWSSADKLLIGYIWPRKYFPWINFWQHSEENKMCYRGLEFGTSGIHAPLHDIITTNRSILLGEKTVRFIDAGETIDTSYVAFLAKTENSFSSVADVEIVNGEIIVTSDVGCIRIELDEKMELTINN